MQDTATTKKMEELTDITHNIGCRIDVFHQWNKPELAMPFFDSKFLQCLSIVK